MKQSLHKIANSNFFKALKKILHFIVRKIFALFTLIGILAVILPLAFKLNEDSVLNRIEKRHEKFQEVAPKIEILVDENAAMQFFTFFKIRDHNNSIKFHSKLRKESFGFLLSDKWDNYQPIDLSHVVKIESEPIPEEIENLILKTLNKNKPLYKIINEKK